MNDLLRNPIFKIVLALVAVFLIIKIIQAALSIAWVIVLVGIVAYFLSDDFRAWVQRLLRRIFKN
jgi:predicted membrane protein